MNHAEMQGALGAYADGELDAARRAALDAHLATCAECRAELEALRELDGAIRNQPVPDPGPQYWARFADRVAARTPSPASAEGARFYDRLTGWLFPHERFAWARAATALAACTLLVTLGLRGFRPQTPVTQSPSEIGARPAPSSQASPEPPTERAASPTEGSLPAREGEDAGRPRPTASREAAESPPTAVSEPRVLQMPPPRAPQPIADGVPESFAKAAPQPDATERRETSAESEKLAAEPEPPAAATQDEAGASLHEEPPSANRALASREIAFAPPAAKGGLESLLVPAHPVEPGAARRALASRDVAVVRVPTPSLAPPVDSLLARDARLWPRRNDPALRSQTATLAGDLAARSGDPRVHSRAVAWLEYLAATSADAAERERWQRMLGSLEDR